MITTHLIPKEELAAYQRWELDSFDAPNRNRPQKTKMADNPEPDNNQKTAAVLPTEEQIARIYQQAKHEGQTAGYQEGHATGYQEGRQSAQIEIKNEMERIRTLLSSLSQDLQRIDQQVAQDLLTLALDLAKKMITQSLQIRPELILPIVQEAIRHLPNSMQHPCLILHPTDAALVRRHMNDQLSHANWEIHEDKQISQGGCLLKANGSEVDASLATRWQRILAAIGQKDNWIDSKE